MLRGNFLQNCLGLFRPHLLLRIIARSVLARVHDLILEAKCDSLVVVVDAIAGSTFFDV
jgi:hypothetical protein